MSHSVGVSNSYYRPTETELLKEYLEIQDFLLVSPEHKLQKQVLELKEKSKDSDYIIKAKLEEKDEQLTAMSEKYDTDIALLKDAIKDMQEFLRNPERLAEIAKKDIQTSNRLRRL